MNYLHLLELCLMDLLVDWLLRSTTSLQLVVLEAPSWHTEDSSLALL
jgi:hypothetical protein